MTRRQCRRQETQTLEAFIDENILDKKYLGILSGPAVTQEQFSGTEIDLLSQYVSTTPGTMRFTEYEPKIT